MAARQVVFDLLCRAGNAALGEGRTSGRPIFVTGNGRSGTTWLGETLSRAPGTFYYREPCHPDRDRLPQDQADAIWSRYLRPGDRDAYFEAKLGAAFQGHVWPTSGHRPADAVRRAAMRPRVLIKEVASFASLPWVADRWDPDVLIILRHPGAYAASVRAMDQNAAELARFALLRDDPRLKADHLGDVAGHLAGIDDPLAASVAAWAIRTRVVLRARRERPDWRLIHYEDLASAPVAGFRRLYGAFGLDWSPELERWIAERTQSDRPGSVTQRKSADRIDRWRDRFAPLEVDAMRRAIEPFGLPVYADAADWPAGSRADQDGV